LSASEIKDWDCDNVLDIIVHGTCVCYVSLDRVFVDETKQADDWDYIQENIMSISDRFKNARPSNQAPFQQYMLTNANEIAKASKISSAQLPQGASFLLYLFSCFGTSSGFWDRRWNYISFSSSSWTTLCWFWDYRWNYIYFSSWTTLCWFWDYHVETIWKIWMKILFHGSTPKNKKYLSIFNHFKTC
jgi:hypothetical protein